MFERQPNELTALLQELKSATQCFNEIVFFRDKCVCVKTLLEEIVILLEPSKYEHGLGGGVAAYRSTVSGNKLLEALKADPEIVHALNDAVNRLKLFMNLFLILKTQSARENGTNVTKRSSPAVNEKITGSKDKVMSNEGGVEKTAKDMKSSAMGFLKSVWVILNAYRIQKELCLRVKDIFSLISRLIPRVVRKDFEKNYKAVTLRPVKKDDMIQMYQSAVEQISTHSLAEIDITLYGAIEKFFTKIRKQNANISDSPVLKPGTLKNSSANTLNFLASNPACLKSALELELFKLLKLNPIKRADISESVVHFTPSDLDKGNFGSLYFAGLTTARSFHQDKKLDKLSRVSKSMETFPKKSNQEDGSQSLTKNIFTSSLQLFKVLRELEILKSHSSDDLLAPFGTNSFQEINYVNLNIKDQRFSLYYKQVKMPLYDMLCNNKSHTLYNFSEFEALAVLKNLSSAVSFLHSKGFIHNKITPRNVFLCFHPCVKEDSKESQATTFLNGGTVKLGNFAVHSAAEVTEDVESFTKTIDDVDSLENYLYKSPEMILSKENSKANDIYALGMLTWRLIHFKKNPVGALMSSVNQRGHLGFQSSNVLLRQSLDPVKKGPVLEFNSQNNLSSIPRAQMLKRIGKAILRGSRPAVDAHISFSSPNKFLRDQIIIQMESCWHPDAYARPSAIKLKQEINSLFEVESNKFLSKEENIFHLFGGIISNLRNGENSKMRSYKRLNLPPNIVQSLGNSEKVNPRASLGSTQSMSRSKKGRNTGKVGNLVSRFSSAIRAKESKDHDNSSVYSSQTAGSTPSMNEVPPRRGAPQKKRGRTKLAHQGSTLFRGRRSVARLGSINPLKLIKRRTEVEGFTDDDFRTMERTDDIDSELDMEKSQFDDAVSNLEEDDRFSHFELSDEENDNEDTSPPLKYNVKRAASLASNHNGSFTFLGM